MRPIFFICALASCSSESYLVVTVDARPSVHDVAELEVATSDGEAVDRIAFSRTTFPATFSMSGLGTAGTVDLSIKAISFDGLLVGEGRTQVQLDGNKASVFLENTDFLVNTDLPEKQYLTANVDNVGGQLAAAPSGRWTVTYGSDCSSCQMYARRFDATAVPLPSADADGTGSFRVTSKNSLRGTAFPSVASAGENTIVVWDYADPISFEKGVACRGINARGSQTAGQLAVSLQTATSVDAAPLPDGTFAVSWLSQVEPKEVFTQIVRADCTPKLAPVSVSGPSLGIIHGAQVASNGSALIYAWVVDKDAARFRVGDGTGTFVGEGTIPAPPDTAIEHVRVATMASGFAVAVRVAATNSSMPGAILLYRTSATGALLSDPVTVTDQSGSNTNTGKVGFGIATRSDGTTMLVWQQCDNGSSGACVNRLDIFGRLVRSDGSFAGEAFLIPTTTAKNQENPSVAALEDAFVVAWNDESGAEPDTSGSAVRARLIYPAQ